MRRPKIAFTRDLTTHRWEVSSWRASDKEILKLEGGRTLVGLSPTNDGARIAVDAHREQRHSRGGFSGLLILRNSLAILFSAFFFAQLPYGPDQVTIRHQYPLRSKLDDSRVDLTGP